MNPVDRAGCPTAVSLFAGIGGLDLAFHRAGYQVVAAVEIDDAARGVIADQMPDTALFTDVCEVTADGLRAAGFRPDHGVLIAGWPCTDLSVAGRRLGLAGTRSSLYWQIVRILTDLRPRWFCLENVPGLLSAVCPCPGRPDSICGGPCADGPHQFPGGACGPGRCMELHGGAMGAVLGSLAELRYGVAYRVLDAQHFGVPQRRRRVVIVGCAGDWAAPVEVLLEPESRGRDSAPRRPARPGTAVVAALRAGGGGGCGPDDNDATGGRLIAGALTTGASEGGGWRAGPDEAAAGQLIVGALTTGTRNGNTDEAAVGQLVVAPALTARYGKGTDSDATDGLLPVAFDTAQITSSENRTNPKPGDPAMPLAATGQPHVAYALRSHPCGVGQGHNTTYVPTTAHALTAEGADASEDGTGRGTPLVPMAFDWQTDGSDRSRPNISSERTSALATTKRDAVAYQQHGSDVGQMGTLRSGHGDVQSGVPFAAAAAAAVRRLTPTECERLQGLPDGWTATSWGQPQSDSARYRELGNSVAVPVFVWVASRMRAHGGTPS